MFSLIYLVVIALILNLTTMSAFIIPHTFVVMGSILAIMSDVALLFNRRTGMTLARLSCGILVFAPLGIFLIGSGHYAPMLMYFFRFDFSQIWSNQSTSQANSFQLVNIWMPLSYLVIIFPCLPRIIYNLLYLRKLESLFLQTESSSHESARIFD